MFLAENIYLLLCTLPEASYMRREYVEQEVAYELVVIKGQDPDHWLNKKIVVIWSCNIDSASGRLLSEL